jgi:hypothetical protein
MNLLRLINLPLAYFVTVVISANHGLLRLKKSFRKLSSPYIFSFVNSLYLVLHTYIKHSM